MFDSTKNRMYYTILAPKIYFLSLKFFYLQPLMTYTLRKIPYYRKKNLTQLQTSSSSASDLNSIKNPQREINDVCTIKQLTKNIGAPMGSSLPAVIVMMYFEESCNHDRNSQAQGLVTLRI